MEVEDCVLSMGGGGSSWLGSPKAVGVQGLSSMKLLFSPLLAIASNDTLKKI